MWYEYEEVRHKLHPGLSDVWTVREVVEKTAELGDTVYLIDAITGKRYSYEDSNTEANRVANSLLSLGLSRGESIAIYMRNRPEYVFSLFACGKLGVIEIPVNTSFHEPEITHLISAGQITTVLVESDKSFLEELAKVAEKNPVLQRVLVLGDMSQAPAMRAKVISLDEMLVKAGSSNPAVTVEGSDPYCAFFTSGTTALPKGAVITNECFLLAAKSVLALPITSEDRNYNCLPLFHAFAQLYSTMGTRCLGASYILSDRFSPKKMFQEIRDNKATWFNFVGGIIPILDAAFRSEDVPNHGARFAFGSPTPPEGWEEKFKVEVFEGYSLSEAPVLFGNFDPYRSKRRKRSFGLPIFSDLGREIKVVDDEGKEAGPGQVGELIQRGTDFITVGYLGNPEATRDAIDQEGWLHTGDLVRKDADGYCYYVDRSKFIIRRAGENIAAAEIEAVVNSHLAVEISAAIPVPDLLREEEVKVFIKLREGAVIDFVDLIKHCSSNLAYHKVPRYIEVLSEFPKTPTERIQKAKLKEWERQRRDHGWDRDKEIPDWRGR